jgi:formate-dependent nitrite reductase membrane component NrfD
MVSDAAKKVAALSETQQVIRKTGIILSRKIWIPKLLYAALPYFYLASGMAALVATLYVDNWIWLLPHYVLFSAICLHMSVFIFRRRHRADDAE